MDIEEGLKRQMGRQVQFVMSRVQGIDVMRLQRYAKDIWATGRRWGRSQARPGREVWIVSGSQIRLGNEDKSRTDLYLKILARAVTSRGKEKNQRRMDWTWPRE